MEVTSPVTPRPESCDTAGVTGDIQTIKTEVIEPTEVFETETSIVEFEFLSTTQNPSPVKRQEVGERSPEDVVDRLFDQATSGDYNAFTNLLSSNKKGGKGTKGTKLPLANENNNNKRKREENSDVRENQTKIHVKNLNQTIRKPNFVNISNVANSKPVLAQEPVKTQKKSLVDYTALTRALSETLESKLAGKDNDVKIVIFCNNKPIQSFSVKNTLEEEESITASETGAGTSGINGVKSTTPEKGEETLTGNSKPQNTGAPITSIKQEVTEEVLNVANEDNGNLVIDESDGVLDHTLNAKTEKIECSICYKQFRLRKSLNQHVYRTHKGAKKVTNLLTTTIGTRDVSESPEKSVASSRAGSSELTSEAESSTVDSESNNGAYLQAHTNSLESVDLTQVKEEPISDVEEEELGYKYIKSLFETTAKENNDDALNSSTVSTPINTPTKSSAGTVIIEGKNLNLTKADLPLTSTGAIEPVYVCEHCGKFYRARKTLKEHFIREHIKNPGEEPLYIYIAGDKYQCSICFVYFHSASELVAHTKTHTGELNCTCKLCGKVYSSVHVLRRHIDNLHADVRPRPFQCELCDYAASNKWHLKEHYRRHTGEQPYTCPICQKSFSHQGTMNRHCKSIHKFEITSSKGHFYRNQYLTLPPSGADKDSTLDLSAGLEEASSDIGQVINQLVHRQSLPTIDISVTKDTNPVPSHTATEVSPSVDLIPTIKKEVIDE